jgi:hypothetical protein
MQANLQSYLLDMILESGKLMDNLHHRATDFLSVELTISPMYPGHRLKTGLQNDTYRC